MNEFEAKLQQVRAAMSAHDLDAVRLRGTDWFAWATCGGSNTVLLTAETGVAEVLVTPGDAWVLTDEIEAARLEAEELPPARPDAAPLRVWAGPWYDPAARETFVREASGGGRVASDRPAHDEAALPATLVAARWSLRSEELERYRRLGRDAAEAMTDVLLEAQPDWTGFELAGAGAEALWARGIHPALTLVGDARRLPTYRHATAARDRLGDRAMLVFCARRHGLFANLTRFVYFREPTAEERRLDDDVAAIEAAAFNASRPGTTLESVFEALRDAYRATGHAGGEVFHHQGGPCGYLSRDAIAVPGDDRRLEDANAVAWNPSLPGAKIEDTVVVARGDHEVLTVDPRWPARTVDGRARPDLLVR